MAVTIVQQNKGFTSNAAQTWNAALGAAPAANNLVVSAVSVNKGATALSVAAPFTERQEYISSATPSVHGALADAVSSQTCAWTKGAAQNTGGQAAWGIYELNVGGTPTYRNSTKTAATETGGNSVTADLGAAPAAGIVIAVIGVDSAFRDNYVAGTSAWSTEADITWTNGFQTLALVITDSTVGDIAGGASFVIGYKEVAAGGATSTTCTWADSADQGFMILSLYDVAGATPVPTVNAGADASVGTGGTFTRTATETLNGATVASRAWTIVSGPSGAGTTIGTAAALSWPVGPAGTYVLRYTLTPTAGDPVTDDVTVTVVAPTRSLLQAWLGIDQVAVKTSSSVGGEQARIAFSTSSAMTSPVYSSVLVTPDAAGISKHAIPALTPNTSYWYQVELGGALIGTPQAFKTLPGTSPQNFSFAFSSCRSHTLASPNADPAAFASAKARGINFFLEIGDIHYRDISANDQAAFQTGYDELFTRTNFADVLKSVPFGYVWDDHDYGGDSSNGNTASKPAAQAVYRNRVPHPNLPSATGGIYHTFVVGRVRIIMLDSRSFRSPVGNTDNATKTMLGTEQKTWLKDLLDNATTPYTIIVSPVGWIGAPGVDSGQDHWAYYSTERTEIGGWITANAAKTKVVFVSGDAHMLAYDDGTNAVAGTPAYHGAALNQTGSTKGGPYSGGTLSGSNQYALMEVTDDGTNISVKYSGIKSDNTVWATHTTTVTTLGGSGVEPGRFFLAY